MTDRYRRLAVFVDNPRSDSYLWMVLESTEDPAVWLDLETGDETFSSWIEAHEAGNDALLAYVEDTALGPLAAGAPEDDAEADE